MFRSENVGFRYHSSNLRGYPSHVLDDYQACVNVFSVGKLKNIEGRALMHFRKPVPVPTRIGYINPPFYQAAMY